MSVELIHISADEISAEPESVVHKIDLILPGDCVGTIEPDGSITVHCLQHHEKEELIYILETPIEVVYSPQKDLIAVVREFFPDSEPLRVEFDRSTGRLKSIYFAGEAPRIDRATWLKLEDAIRGSTGSEIL